VGRDPERLRDHSAVSATGRTTYRLEKGEERQDEIGRFNGRRVPAAALVGTLDRLGWYRGDTSNHGVINEHYKPYPSANVSALIQYETGVGMGMMQQWDDQEITHCLFLEGTYKPVAYQLDHKECVPLGEVDPVVISEVLGDLTTVAEKAK
jgi:hypothetical protein